MSNIIALAPEHPDYACQLVDFVLREAIQRNASDIHFQPRAQHFEILLRIDGVLQPIGQAIKNKITDPIVRLLVLAGLPTYNLQKPMEGRLRESPVGVEMRLGTFPTVHGTRAVIRLMVQQQQLTTLNQLELPREVHQNIELLTWCQDGMVLLTGPAGSGKTTTLYACLRLIASRTPRRNIVTIEDPIESILDGVSQSQMVSDGGHGMTLDQALRSVLRQDPEVLLIGEIRDSETAAAALASSLTGHLIFSTLHAGDGATALRRLIELNVAPYLVRSGLRAVCSQRLLRRLCAQCKTPDEQACQLLSTDGCYKSNGCSECAGTGYCGRFVIAELLRLDQADPCIESALDLLCHGGHISEIRQKIAGVPDWRSLRSRAEQAVMDGRTSFSEVLRVLGPGS